MNDVIENRLSTGTRMFINIYCVLKFSRVYKNTRFHFEIKTHQRFIDILYPTVQTIDFLMQLDLRRN